MKSFDKYLGKLLPILLIALFLAEFSAGLAIAHLETVHECQASQCVNDRIVE